MTPRIVTLPGHGSEQFYVLHRLPRNVRQGDYIKLTDYTHGWSVYEGYARVTDVEFCRQGRPKVYGRYDQSLTQITWARSSVSWPFDTWGYAPITYRGRDNQEKVEVYRHV